MVWLALHHWSHRCNAGRFMRKLLCTSFGLGLLPKAPGTWGSLAPVFVVLGCGHYSLAQGWLLGILILLLLTSSIVTVQLASWYSSYFHQKDPPQVVSDEVAGPIDSTPWHGVGYPRTRKSISLDWHGGTRFCVVSHLRYMETLGYQQIATFTLGLGCSRRRHPCGHCCRCPRSHPHHPPFLTFYSPAVNKTLAWFWCTRGLFICR